MFTSSMTSYYYVACFFSSVEFDDDLRGSRDQTFSIHGNEGPNLPTKPIAAPVDQTARPPNQ
jgi:hypothetical protein